MKPNLIAPCGMNCCLCVAYLRDKNKCPGCRIANKEYCRKCTIANCKIIKKNKWKFCSSSCEKFPCTRLKNLDKRYRKKYDFSMIDNLNIINKKGIREFIRQQKRKYIKANKILCIHNKKQFDLK